jgi:hypothetical protein
LALSQTARFGFDNRQPTRQRGSASSLLVFFVHSDRFQIFGFNDYTAVEAFQVVDAVTPGNDHSAVMLANGRYGLDGLHKADYGFILTMSLNLSSPKIKDF